jgi:DNA-binding NarL/FixJ family response regulator/DNA-binding Lrp family transcriptional regulator
MSLPIVRTAIFAGREPELALLSDNIASAIRGSGTVTIVRGAAGIGKSRLVAAALEAARGKGAVTIAASNYDYVRAPFGPFADVLRALRERIPKSAPGVSADKVPYERLIGLSSDTGPSTDWDKRRLFVIVWESLARAAREAPIVVAIDDVHWADPESLELASYIATRLSETRLALIFTTREIEDGDADTDDAALAAIDRIPAAHRITLGAIPDSAARLIAASISGGIDGRMLDKICERADGNPFYIEELARAVRERPESASLPQSLKATTLKHVRSLEERDRETLEIASALGREFSIDALADAAGIEQSDLVRTLRRARDHGIIEEAGKNLRFRHELLRVAIYDEMLWTQRRAIHKRIAERLPVETTAPEAFAYHWAGAGEMRKAAEWALRVGDLALEIGAYASARDSLLSAIESETLDDGERAIADEKIARAFDRLGDAPQAVVHLQRAVATTRGGAGRGDVVRLEIALSSALYRAGDVDAAISACERALAEATATGDERFAAHVALATYHAYRGSAERANEYIALADASNTDRPTIERLRLEWARAAAAIYADDDSWLKAARRAVELAEGDVTPSERASTLMSFASMTRERGREDLASEALKRAIAVADSNGLTLMSAYARCELIDDLATHGRLGDVYTTLVEIAMLNVTANVVKVLAAGLGLPVLVELHRTELLPQFSDPALLEIAFASGEQFRIAPLVAAHAFAAWVDGRTADAVALIDRGLAVLDSPQYIGGPLTTMARCGTAAQAEAVSVILARGSAAGLGATYRDVVRAIVEKGRSNRSASVRAAESARASARDRSAPLVEAIALELLDRRDEALAIYDRCGALASSRRLSTKRNNPLSPREDEVAGYLRRGLTNRAIADAMTLSERTVEHHVASVFAKLGVRSRAEFLTLK